MGGSRNQEEDIEIISLEETNYERKCMISVREKSNLTTYVGVAAGTLGKPGHSGEAAPGKHKIEIR